MVVASTMTYLRDVVVGRQSADQIGGPIKIAQISVEAAKLGFGPLLESWKSLSDQQQTEMHASLTRISSEAAGEYKSRLENVSNTWILATVAKLDHQSRQVVSGISASAEEKLRAACSEVFADVGESLRKRLQEITSEVNKPAAPERK